MQPVLRRWHGRRIDAPSARPCAEA